ncbi:hypothetical protein ACIBEJ_42700 [Nonomuraea sp. NPDC050790]|uniref:hypothetical protein n=1 Tax=Nonomuraea sp. NPDC050790 TaxID=3364371 RepID=UPI0037A74EA9
MSRIVMVRYQTRPEAADLNQQLVEKVFAELNADDPGGLRYLTLRLEDGVSFVHVAITENEDSPLSGSPAFAEFQRGIGDRVVAPPTVSSATLVGSYRAV